VCDGLPDCPDAEDEVDCSICYSHDSDNLPDEFCYKSCPMGECICASGYFQCVSGGCVHIAKLCDCFADCADASDEVCPPGMCNTKRCPSLENEDLEATFHRFYDSPLNDHRYSPDFTRCLLRQETCYPREKTCI
jgi:low density lipoprotein-related protein 2